MKGEGEAAIAETTIKSEPSNSDDVTDSNVCAPLEESKQVGGAYATRGVKVRYVSDSDEFEEPTKKKVKKGSAKEQYVYGKENGIYKPSKKRINRKVDPNRCEVCRQRLDDPELKFFPGHPQGINIVVAQLVAIY